MTRFLKKSTSGTLKVKIVVIKFSDVTPFWSKSTSDTLKFKIVIIELSAHVTFLEQIFIRYTQSQKII